MRFIYFFIWLNLIKSLFGREVESAKLSFNCILHYISIIFFCAQVFFEIFSWRIWHRVRGVCLWRNSVCWCIRMYLNVEPNSILITIMDTVYILYYILYYHINRIISSCSMKCIGEGAFAQVKNSLNKGKIMQIQFHYIIIELHSSISTSKDRN